MRPCESNSVLSLMLPLCSPTSCPVEEYDTLTTARLLLGSHMAGRPWASYMMRRVNFLWSS